MRKSWTSSVPWWVHAVAAVLALVVLPALAFRYGFVADDAFIAFRYARNLVAGHGLVFNPGDRVEGFSSPLFVILVAALHGVGADPVVAGRGLSLVSGSGLVLLTYIVGLRVAPGRWMPALGAAALVAVAPSLAIWSLGGLETTLFALLSLASIVPLLADPPGPRSLVLAAAIAGAAAITRPEGTLLLALVVGCGLLRARRRAIVPGLLVFGAIVGSVTAIRFVYYRELLPNTYYAKGAFTPAHLARGADYVLEFAKQPFWIVALAAAAWGAFRGRDAATTTIASLAVLQVAVVVSVGGDGLPAYRFLVPAIAPIVLLAALGVESLVEPIVRSPRARPVLAAAVVAVLALLGSRAPRDAQFALYEGHVGYEIPAWSETGRWLRANVPPETVIAAVPIGAVAYYSELPAIDLMGLTDRHIARSEHRLASGWAGHEKTDGAYVLSRAPDLLLLGNIYVSTRRASGLADFAPYGNPFIFERERDIVENPEFARDYRIASVEMSPGRFLNAFARQSFLEKVAR